MPFDGRWGFDSSAANPNRPCEPCGIAYTWVARQRLDLNRANEGRHRVVNDYFGPPILRKEWERQIATPVGQECMWCGEPIAEGDVGTMMATMISEAESGVLPAHYECTMRQVIGSVGHQLGLCSCYGGTEEDPPGLTARQAAQLALAEHERRMS